MALTLLQGIVDPHGRLLDESAPLPSGEHTLACVAPALKMRLMHLGMPFKTLKVLRLLVLAVMLIAFGARGLLDAVVHVDHPFQSAAFAGHAEDGGDHSHDHDDELADASGKDGSTPGKHGHKSSVCGAYSGCHVMIGSAVLPAVSKGSVREVYVVGAHPRPDDLSHNLNRPPISV